MVGLTKPHVGWLLFFVLMCALVCALMSVWIAVVIASGTQPQVNRVVIDLPAQSAADAVPLSTLKVALLSDLHIEGDADALTELAALMIAVVDSKPDLIMFAGDYVKNPGELLDLNQHRIAVAKAMSDTGGIPTFAVLGNHENWTVGVQWQMALRDAGVPVLANSVQQVKSLNLCVRGLGDYYSGAYQYVEFPSYCEGGRKLSLTHDPAGAFDARVKGLVLAGHTHCGQVSLPFLGPLWVPTDAPKSAHCGLHQDEQRQVFVSAGVGTSVLPFRLNAQAQWDVITLRFFAH